MTDVEFDCPHCGNPVLGDDSMRGRPMRCPSCKGEIRISLNRPPAVHDDEELDVFEFHPSAKAFLGELCLGFSLLPAFGLGLIFLIDVWVRRRSIHYRLTNQRFFTRTGFIARKVEELELFRVKDVKVQQSMLQRLLRIGSVTIYSSDDTAPEIRLLGVRRPDEVKETIRTCYRSSRRREGMQAAEFIPS